MFITKHHVAPVLFGVGLSEPQSATLVGFRQSRGFTLSECVQVSAVHCSLHCHVAHIGNLLFLQLPRDNSTRAASFPPHFLLHSPLHTLRKFPFPPCTRRIIELYLDIQRVTNRRSNPVLRQISAVVKPSLCRKTTAPRSSGGLRDMRFCRFKNKNKNKFN